MSKSGWFLAVALATLSSVSSAAMALTIIPPEPCEGVEGGMYVSWAEPFAAPGAGFTVGPYWSLHYFESQRELRPPLPGPVPALADFWGIRIVDCRTGEMLVLDTRDSEAGPYFSENVQFVESVVGARGQLTVERIRSLLAPHFSRLVVLRDTAETCAYSTFFPDLRPRDMTAYTERSDVTLLGE